MRSASSLFDPGIGGPGYLYVKFADFLAAHIHDETLPPGAMLPCEGDLAAQYGISVTTVRRATQLLRERGLVVTLPSRGTFVAVATSLDSCCES
jgi:GntR family transcriptional regulator